jgi:predicted heme/steroid binding protein
VEELRQYNGKNGAPAYIAYQGVVYDVTRSWHWRKGEHQVRHKAGNDLTSEMGQAPHGEDVFRKFPVVGILADVGELP